MTAVNWLINYMLENFYLTDESLEKFEQAKQMEKQQTLLFAEEYDEYVFKCGSATMEEYYNETYVNKGSDERIVEATKTISYQKLDCPYDFTSRCTMGSCDCKPIKETTSSQTEISDEEIEEKIEKVLNKFKQDHTVLNLYPSNILQNIAEFGAKWYREQLKSK